MKSGQKKLRRRGNAPWWLVWAASAVLACSIRESKDHTSVLYAAYNISGSEDQPEVTCLLQFKDDREARPRRLIPPSYVLLDRLELAPDSSRFTGVFYERRYPAATFTGKHQVSYHNGDQPYTETFEYQPITLAAELPDSISRRDFIIRLNGVEGDRRFHLSLTDTSFASNDFYELVTLSDGVLRLGPEQLNGLTTGPVVMEIIYEEERPLQKQPGQIRISYSLRREFVLTN